MQPQQAFDELATITLADHDLAAVMDKIAELARRTIPGAAEVSVTMWEAGRPSTIASTGGLATALDERQYEAGHGPCLDSVQGVEPVHVSDTSDEPRWPEWAQLAADTGVTSSFTVPVPLQREVSAALNMYATSPDPFDADSRALAQTFAAYAGVALANMHLYDAQARVAEQLQEAMASRAVIEQAKGILMGQLRCGAEDAFTALVKQSQERNVKLRDVAEQLVQQTAKGA
jgi:GAF domain-containing protein